MTPETQERMSLLCARDITRVSDMTPIEIAATLNSGTRTLEKLANVRKVLDAFNNGVYDDIETRDDLHIEGNISEADQVRAVIYLIERVVSS